MTDPKDPTEMLKTPYDNPLGLIEWITWPGMKIAYREGFVAASELALMASALGIDSADKLRRMAMFYHKLERIYTTNKIWDVRT